MQKYIKLIIWLTVIFYLCLAPANKIPENEILKIPYFDKVVHLVIFFVLTLFIASIQLKQNRKYQQVAINNIIITVLLGGLIELLQFILPIQRSPQFADYAFDITGTLLALLILKVKSLQNLALKYL